MYVLFVPNLRSSRSAATLFTEGAAGKATLAAVVVAAYVGGRLLEDKLCCISLSDNIDMASKHAFTIIIIEN